MWPLVTALINAITRKRTTEEWEKFNQDHPRLANVVRFFRSAGLDVGKVIQSLLGIFLKQVENKIGPNPFPQPSEPEKPTPTPTGDETKTPKV